MEAVSLKKLKVESEKFENETRRQGDKEKMS